MLIGLRVEDKLDGASNFSPWKEQIMLILEVNDLLELTKPTITPPLDATLLAEHNKKDAKARMLILDVLEGPHYSSSIGEEVGQGDVGGSDQVIPE